MKTCHRRPIMFITFWFDSSWLEIINLFKNCKSDKNCKGLTWSTNLSDPMSDRPKLKFVEGKT